MLCKKAASMTIGISMDQEICLILGRVSLSLLYWKRNLQTDFCGPGETDKTASDIQARSFMARNLENNGKECQAEGEAKVVNSKTKARWCKKKSRGIYFIDPEDKEFKETIRNARKKLDTPTAPAMPCKTSKKSKKGEIRSKTNDFKSKFACILEASESTRLRMEESLPNYHEDHIAGRGDNSLQHYNLVHKFIPMPQAMKVPAATRAAVDKEWEKLEKIPAWDLTTVRSKSEVIDEARTKGAKVHFASLMDICHLKNAELEAKHQKYKGRVVLRRHCERWFWILCSIYRTRIISITNDGSKSHGYHIQLPGCAGQAADTVSAYTQVKNGRCFKIIENSQIGMSRHLDSSTTTQMTKIMVQYGRPSRSSWAKSVRSSFGRTVMGEGHFGKSYWSTVGRRFPIGNGYTYTVKKGYSYQCMRMTSNWLERNKTLIRCGTHSIKKSIWENEHLSSIMKTWDVLKDNVK